MGQIRVEIEGVSGFIAALEAKKRAISDATATAVQIAGDQLQSDARSNISGQHAPGFWHVGGVGPKTLNRVSGNLQQSIHVQPAVSQGAGRYMTKVGPTAIYARVQELGAHIEAKRARYLTWYDAQNNVQRFVKSVYVPPRPYFIPARETLPPKMQKDFRVAWTGAWA